MVYRLFNFAVYFIAICLVWSAAAGLYIVMAQSPAKVSDTPAIQTEQQQQVSTTSAPISYEYSDYTPQWPMFNPGFYEYPPIEISH